MAIRGDSLKARWPGGSPLFWTGALLLWGTGVLAFGSLGLLGRSIIELEGTLTFSQTTCEGPTGHRCSTVYLIKSEETRRTVRYRAYSNDQALARRLPVGTHLRKEKWSLSYEVNGVRVEDFPRLSYLSMTFGGLTLFLTGLLRFVRSRQWRDLARAIGGEDSP